MYTQRGVSRNFQGGGGGGGRFVFPSYIIMNITRMNEQYVMTSSRYRYTAESKQILSIS